MRNQKTLESLYNSTFETEIKMMEETYEETELYHHGVLGMSWGKRHGPPYPLTGVDKKVARAEAKRKREKEKQLKKARKVATKKREEAAKEAKKEEAILKKKQRLLKKGDIEEIRKNAKLFTNEEMQYAIERHSLLEDSKKRGENAKRKEVDTQSFDKVAIRLGQAATIAASIGSVARSSSEVKRFVDSFKESDANMKMRDLDQQLKGLDVEMKKLEAKKKDMEYWKLNEEKIRITASTLYAVDPAKALRYINRIYLNP